MLETPVDYRSLPTNPLKDLLIFEERVQHNIHSLQRLRFHALMRIVLASVACWILLSSHRSLSTDYYWLSLTSLIGSGLFFLLAVVFLIHTIYTRRLTLLGRYRSQCLRLLRIYNLDLRAGLDSRHLSTLRHASAVPTKLPSGPFVTVKRRTAGRIYDLLDAYRFENWRRKAATSQSPGKN